MNPVKAVVKWMWGSYPGLVLCEILYTKPNIALPAGDTFSCVAALPGAAVDKDATEEQRPEKGAWRRKAFYLQCAHAAKQPRFMKILKQKSLERQNIYNSWSVSWYEYSLLYKRFCCSIALNVFLVCFINVLLLKILYVLIFPKVSST